MLLQGYSNYSSEEFMDYLNRYCTGICLLKHLISEIHMKYEVVHNVFGSDYCRFLIDVNFVDFKSLSLKELNVANQYFYNSCSNSGSQYVSFRYNSFNSRGINEKIVLLFISCYGFAEQLLKGFIRNIIPPTCSITIADLKNEPLFCYIVDFIVDEPYISFEKRYADVEKRDFDTDVYLHNTLKEKSSSFSGKRISDIDIHRVGGGSCTDIRSFVLEHNIPFSIHSSSTISRIYIDRNALRDKLMNIQQPFKEDIYPDNILREIIEREKMDKFEELKKLSLFAEIPFEIGDLILLKSSSTAFHQKVVGIVTSFQVISKERYEVEYHPFNKDLSESVLNRVVSSTKLDYFLKREQWLELKKSSTLKNRIQLVPFIMQEGVKLGNKN